MILKIGDTVIYKTYNRNGDLFQFGKKAPHVRKIIRLLTNVNGEKIIEWDSKNSQGVCIPSTWQDWREGINEGKRRGIAVLRF